LLCGLCDGTVYSVEWVGGMKDQVGPMRRDAVLSGHLSEGPEEKPRKALRTDDVLAETRTKHVTRASPLLG
jgi:hypothetical protein